MTEFSDEQEAVLATATLVFPAGFTLTEDRADDRGRVAGLHQPDWGIPVVYSRTANGQLLNE